jgi:hypothetical protein
MTPTAEIIGRYRARGALVPRGSLARRAIARSSPRVHPGIEGREHATRMPVRLARVLRMGAFRRSELIGLDCGSTRTV